MSGNNNNNAPGQGPKNNPPTSSTPRPPANRPTVPAFGQFTLPVHPARPRASQEPSQAAQEASFSHKKAGNARKEPLHFDFAGHLEHGPDSTSAAPYNRSSPAKDDGEPEVKKGDWYQAVIEYQNEDGKQHVGSFSGSEFKFRPELCATTPGASLRVHDKIGDTHFALEFDLGAFEEVPASIVDDDSDTLGTVRAAASKAKSSKFFRFHLRRKLSTVNNDGNDTALYNDSPVDWRPTTENVAGYHGQLKPYLPGVAALSVSLEQQLDTIRRREMVTIWVAINNLKYLNVFRNFVYLMEEVAHCGRENRFMVDWYFSKHRLYATAKEFSSAEQGTNAAKYFDRFHDDK